VFCEKPTSFQRLADKGLLFNCPEMLYSNCSNLISAELSSILLDAELKVCRKLEAEKN